MNTLSYEARRQQIETYFDRTAAEAWKRLTSDAPVGRIRATVRAGRDDMRATLLGWLPADLSGRRLLDAGCGTGALAVEAARRGAEVVAIDLSPTLVELAESRAGAILAANPGNGNGRIQFRVGDMLDPDLGAFDHVAAMDSIIHYAPADLAEILGKLASRTSHSIVFTFAPRTRALSVMHAAGRLFPRSDRAPQIEPANPDALARNISEEPGLKGWRTDRTRRISSGFYISQGMELIRA